MARAGVTIDSGELPSAEGVAEGQSLFRVIRRWQTIANGNFRDDCRFLKQMIDETDRLRLWEKNVGGFTFKDRDDFLRNKVLIDYELTEQDMTEIVAMLKRGEPDGVRQKLAATMKAAGPVPEQRIGKGMPGPGRGKKTGSVATRFSSRRDISYLAARIKRDRPDIAAAVERGEYKTMRAAAIAAEIIKPPTTLTGLRRLWKKATPSEREAFLKEIQS
jgi:hypothetical protein